MWTLPSVWGDSPGTADLAGGVQPADGDHLEEYGGDGAVIYQIGQLTDIIDGDRGKNYPKQNEFSSRGYCLFLNAGNVTPTGFSFEENSFITQEKDSSLRKGKLQRGDIVYTTRGTVGNAAFYSEAIPFKNVRINSGMVILRCHEDIIDRRYLYQILKSEYFRPYFKKYCTGSAQPQLPIMNFSKD